MRSSSVRPPQIPCTWPVRWAKARHSARTRQRAQTLLASATSSRHFPAAEIGKNNSGSTDWHAAMIRQFSPAASRRAARSGLEGPPLASLTPSASWNFAMSVTSRTQPDCRAVDLSRFLQLAAGKDGDVFPSIDGGYITRRRPGLAPEAGERPGETRRAGRDACDIIEHG